jgi:cyanophycinase
MRKKPKGKLIIIGGAERNDDGTPILETVAQEVNHKHRPLLIITVASYEPDVGIDEYIELFKGQGVQKVEVLDLPTREATYNEENVKKVAEAGAIFFTGGDQLRVTSQLGDSPIYRCMRDCYLDGCLIAGTSAGAAAMPETMIIGGPGDESNRISTLSMASGLGLIEDVVIDSHFAERGRMGRLLGAVAQNPRNVGIGIDESTAILVEQGKEFTVLGVGAVYVVDGTNISYSSLSEEAAEGVVTIHDVTLHVMGTGDRFDLKERRPVREPVSAR